MLERMSSEVVYEDPRRKAVPLILNLGVPNLYEGIGTSNVGIASNASSCFDPVPGLSITTLNAPASESLTGICCSSIVEKEWPRLWFDCATFEGKY